MEHYKLIGYSCDGPGCHESIYVNCDGTTVPSIAGWVRRRSWLGRKRHYCPKCAK